MPSAQKAAFVVLGVLPPTMSASSPIVLTFHPAGTGPSLDSSNASGNRAATSWGSPVSRPSAFARTGSKSTNHDLNSARAIASSVSFMRRFSADLVIETTENPCDLALDSDGWERNIKAPLRREANVGSHIGLTRTGVELRAKSG